MTAPRDTTQSPLASQWAWHYTTRTAHRAIKPSGYLLPTASGFEPVERYLLWFSMNDVFEPSALRYITTPDGLRRRATVHEMMRAGRGLVRYGYSPYRLLRGIELLHAARIDAAEMDLFHRAGRAMGANSAIWLVSIRSIPVGALIVEFMNHAGDWMRVADGDGLR